MPTVAVQSTTVAVSSSGASATGPVLAWDSTIVYAVANILVYRSGKLYASVAPSTNVDPATDVVETSWKLIGDVPINDVVTGGTNRALSAQQGVYLKSLIDAGFTVVAASATQTAVVGGKYLLGNNSTLVFPAAADGKVIQAAPEGGDWATSGINFTPDGSDTIGGGQAAIPTFSSLANFIKKGTNWVVAI